MNKIYHKNVISDLLKFKKNSITNWDKSNIKSAQEWRKKNPKDKKGFINYYQTSKTYLDAVATYNATPKKLRLIEKILKVIKPLKKVLTIIDYGCGPLSDSLFLASLGYKVIAMDLKSEMFNFAKFRLDKYKIKGLQLIDIDAKEEIPECDLILSLDVLEHVFNPYETLSEFFKTKCKYILMTTAFGIHPKYHSKLPQHTNYDIHKIEKYIEQNGYKKKKIKMVFPPRLYIKK